MPDTAHLTKIGSKVLSAKYLSQVYSGNLATPRYLLNDTMTLADPPKFAAAQALAKVVPDVNLRAELAEV